MASSASTSALREELLSRQREAVREASGGLEKLLKRLSEGLQGVEKAVEALQKRKGEVEARQRAMQKLDERREIDGISSLEAWKM